jgi:membrane-associated protein
MDTHQLIDLAKQFVDYFLHLDVHLDAAVKQYGTLIYAILTGIIFCETGLVVTPILPGDSLLFAAGAIGARGGGLNPIYLTGMLMVAAVLGDTVNYGVGKFFSPWIVKTLGDKIIKKEHLDRTHAFFEKYGGKTIILARFVPIIRTFAPFVAGAGAMTYTRFFFYNIIGGVAWVFIGIYSGYFFGNIAWVKAHFSIVLLVIVVLSLMPGLYEFLSIRYHSSGPRCLAYGCGYRNSRKSVQCEKCGQPLRRGV